MKEAISLYTNSIISADEANYPDYLSQGFICPLCHNNLFWTQGFLRNEVYISPCFKHHKNTGLECEARAKQYDYQKAVGIFSKESRNQRLQLFNNNFWEILTTNKYVPSKKQLNQISELNAIADACHARWNPEIVFELCQKLTSVASKESFIESMSAYNIPNQERNRIKTNLDSQIAAIKSMANQKIIKEIVYWLPSESAATSFRLLVALSMVDAIQIREMSNSPDSFGPLTTGEILHCMAATITITDWVESLKEFDKHKNAGRGFGIKQPKR